MTKDQENKDGKRNGLLVTVAFHVLILVLCIFLGFRYQDPPEGQMDMELALGDFDTGNNQQVATSQKVSDQPIQEQVTPTNSDDQPVDEEFATQDESAVAINQKTEKKPKKDPVKTKEKIDSKEVVKEREIDEKLKNTDLGSLLQGQDQTGGSGAGESGRNKGGENGIPGGLGTGGSGKGGEFDFGGRRAIKYPELTHDCGVQGAICVRITLNSQGDVTDANVVVSKSTSTDGCLRNLAIKRAKQMKYNSSSNAVPVQTGEIYLNFKIN